MLGVKYNQLTPDIENLSSINPQSQRVFVYEAEISGIRCTSCSKKIKTNLTDFKSIQSVQVNVIGGKTLVNVLDPADIPAISQKITSLGFKVVTDFSEIVLSKSSTENTRKIYFQLGESAMQPEEIAENVKQQFAAVLAATINAKQTLMVEYNFKAIRGNHIWEYLNTTFPQQVSIKDPYIDSFKKSKVEYEATSLKDMLIAGGVMASFFVFTLVLPHFDFFSSIELFPDSMSILTLYVIGMCMLTGFTLIYFGRRIFINAVTNYQKFRMMNMETLVMLGCLSSLIMTVFMMFTYIFEEGSSNQTPQQAHENDKHRREMIEELVHMMETASLILAIITVGKYQEGKAKQSILGMADQLFPEDQLLRNVDVTLLEIKNQKFDIDVRKSIEVSYLDRDDFMLVKAPFRLLNDVTVMHIIASSGVVKASDQILYGQNEAFEVQKGQVLRSGAEIISGEVIVQINNSIEDSLLYQTSKQLNLAQNNSEQSETGITALLKKLSEGFVKAIIMIALVTLALWSLIIAANLYDVSQKCVWCYPFERFVSVLVASCPCALGLAIPSVIATSLNMAMQNSILIKKNTVFEKISRIKAIVFDKTGTLFTKAERVDDFTNVSSDNAKNQLEDSEIWQIILLLEKNVKHPLAELLYKEAIQRGSDAVSCTDFFINPMSKKSFKNGLSAPVNRSKNQSLLSVFIGNMALMVENHIEVPESIQKEIERIQQLGSTVILIAGDVELLAYITLHNTTNLRPEARSVVDHLQKQLKKEVYILSGDAQNTVVEVGSHLGIPSTNLIGDVDSNQKKQFLKNLRETEKKEVMMVGDGLNDILSLEEACVGVSINATSEMNLMASDIVILDENLWKIAYIFHLVKKSQKFIYINLFWAFSYNFFMIPLAAGCFCSWGVKVTPLLSTTAMSLSSAIVVLFSNLMKYKDFTIPKDSTTSAQQEEEVEMKLQMTNQSLNDLSSQTI